MRCSHCGAENSRYDLRCAQCGELLRNATRLAARAEDRHSAAADHDAISRRGNGDRSPRADRAADVFDWSEEPSSRVEPRNRRRAVREEHIDTRDDRIEQPTLSFRSDESRSLAPVTRRGYRSAPNRALEPIEGSTQRGSQKGRGAFLTKKEQKVFSGDSGGRAGLPSWMKFAVLGLLVLAVGVGAVIGARALLGSDWLPALGGIAASADELAGPTVEEAEVDGEMSHIFTFTGQADEYIYIPELKRNFKIIQGVAKVTVPDSMWIGEDPETTQIEVSLNPVLYTAGAKQKPMQPVTYTVTIPASPLKVISPQEDGAVTHTSMYLVEIQVEPGSVVTIAGEPVSDLMNDEGIITYNVNLEPKGDNTIPIHVKTEGYRSIVKSLVINRPYMEIPLEINANTPVTSQTSTMTITGRVEPGATLTVEPKQKGDINIDSAGAFSFDVSLKDYGENEIVLTASSAGKQDSVITHTVNFMPQASTYTEMAWALKTQDEYNTLVQGCTTTFLRKVYECGGKIHEMIREDDPMMFLFNVGTEEEPRIVAIEMISGKDVKPGLRYDIYADVAGEYEGYPLLIGRYRYQR